MVTNFSINAVLRVLNMSITSTYEADVVINSVEDTDTLNYILYYALLHAAEWGNRQVIWDLRLFNFHSIDKNSINYFLSKSKPLSEMRLGLKTAIIADTDLGFGMMRMLEFMADEKLSFTVRVYRNKEKAFQWLTDEKETV